MKTVFGPVPSRRLGRSLGIDLVPPKTCTFDCVYCESGRTDHLSLERRTFVDPDVVVRELEDHFSRYPEGVDALTLSSAGEPTLYEPLGELLRSVKKRFPSRPLVALTNGSLLWDARVRRDLLAADRVVPSLDAVEEAVFKAVNRPHPLLKLSEILEGLEAFGREYGGELFLEVLLVAGYNDHPRECRGIRRMVDRLNPDAVELNTVVRPPARPGVRGLTRERMEEVRAYFPAEKTTIVGAFQGSCAIRHDEEAARRVLEMVLRRPCTADEMAASLGVSPDELHETLKRQEAENRLERLVVDGRVYYGAPSSRRSQ